MILTIGFLLLVSMTLSAVLSALVGRMSDVLPSGDGIWIVLNFVLSLLVFILLFAAIFRFLPDVRIGWRDVWLGAVITAALFAIGKTIIGLYLGKSSVGSAYGAAGSLIVLLVWVYYSSFILFLGAELTQAYAPQRDHAITPDKHAVVEGRKVEEEKASAQTA